MSIDKHRKTKRPVTRIMRVIGFVVGAGVVWYCTALVGALFNDRQSSISEPFSLEIKEGNSVADIEARLVQGELLNERFAWLFRWWGSQKGYDKRVKVGGVKIPYGASIATMWELLKNPTNQSVRLRFIEGRTLRGIKIYLEEKGVQGDLYKLAGEPLSSDSMEGYLFPDTYEFFTDAIVRDVVGKMRANFDVKVTPELRAEIERQGFTLDQIITIASIIELEVTGREDRRMVSDIIRRRLANGWMLQMDSTINYIHGNRRRSATFDELESTSPYNTYKFKGLPSGPIANPGLQAIEAAVYPIKNNFWFFLHAADGSIKYGRTFEEHQENRKFLR